MEGCVLCLDINNEFVDCIKVASAQWQEFNIKNLIDKHLWIMETAPSTSWLCCTCWQALYDFHKFYMRIEDAHMDFGRLLNGERERHDGLTNAESDHHEENKELCNETVLNEPCHEPEIFMDRLLIETPKPTIENENEPDLVEDNLSRCKRQRQSKDILKSNQIINKDPLNSTKAASKRQNRKINVDALTDNPEKNQDSDLFKITKELLSSSSSSDSDSLNSYTDIDHEPSEDIRRHKKTNKRRHTNNSLDSHDSDTDIDDDLKEDCDTKRTKPSSKQKDQFIYENFRISCVLCQVSMVDFKSLLQHFHIDHNERGYAVCCNKKFYHRGKLLEHVQWHVYPSNHKCNQCGKELSSQTTLKTHQLLHVAEEEKKFACSQCGKTYPEQNKLTTHINRVHLNKYIRICDICGKQLRCGEALQRHILEHEGKSLPSISCDICGLLVTNKHGLKRHKSMQHPPHGKRDYTCDICSKVSPNIYALRKHINCTHKADNLHKCNMCGRAFKRPLALREHMATHTGIALYTCPWCPKTFNASGGMHAHRKTQHPIEWEESRRQKILEKYKTADVTELTNVNSSNLFVFA